MLLGNSVCNSRTKINHETWKWLMALCSIKHQVNWFTSRFVTTQNFHFNYIEIQPHKLAKLKEHIKKMKEQGKHTHPPASLILLIS